MSEFIQINDLFEQTAATALPGPVEFTLRRRDCGYERNDQPFTLRDDALSLALPGTGGGHLGQITSWTDLVLLTNPITVLPYLLNRQWENIKRAESAYRMQFEAIYADMKETDQMFGRYIRMAKTFMSQSDLARLDEPEVFVKFMREEGPEWLAGLLHLAIWKEEDANLIVDRPPDEVRPMDADDFTPFVGRFTLFSTDDGSITWVGSALLEWFKDQAAYPIRERSTSLFQPHNLFFGGYMPISLKSQPAVPGITEGGLLTTIVEKDQFAVFYPAPWAVIFSPEAIAIIRSLHRGQASPWLRVAKERVEMLAQRGLPSPEDVARVVKREAGEAFDPCQYVPVLCDPLGNIDWKKIRKWAIIGGIGVVGIMILLARIK